MGLVSTLMAVSPPAVKQGGGVMNQLSSMGHDSKWMKQDSLASGRCSKGGGKQGKTGELPAAGASARSPSSAEQLVQVSAAGEEARDIGKSRTQPQGQTKPETGYRKAEAEIHPCQHVHKICFTSKGRGKGSSLMIEARHQTRKITVISRAVQLCNKSNRVYQHERLC